MNPNCNSYVHHLGDFKLVVHLGSRIVGFIIYIYLYIYTFFPDHISQVLPHIVPYSIFSTVLCDFVLQKLHTALGMFKRLFKDHLLPQFWQSITVPWRLAFHPMNFMNFIEYRHFKKNANMENYGKFMANNVSWTNHPGVDADPFPLVACLYPSVLVYGHFTQTLAKMETNLTNNAYRGQQSAHVMVTNNDL